MNAYLEIIRPGNAVMAVIAVLLVMLISGNFTINAFLACIVVLMVIGGGNAINDYFDHKIDAINKPSRPIPSGRISLNAAKIYSVALFVIGTIIAFIIEFLPGLIALFTSIVLILYAYNLKKMPLIGNMAVSFFIGLTFIFGAVVVGEPSLSILGFSPFFITMMREIVKDMEDMEGDKKEGAKTLPILYGLRSSAVVATLFMIFAVVTSPIPYFIGILTVFYLPLLFVGDIIFIAGAISVLKNQSTENTQKVSKWVKIGMLVVLLSYAVGSPFLISLI
ncbi:MAG: UbiA family prenyltransferase [Methanobacterium sp.]